MGSYRIRLRETRIAEDGTDDVAVFDVVREEDGQTWQVPAFLSPLFRVLYMEPDPPLERRRDMVAGLGARAIVERLERGREPADLGSLVFAIDYPGVPGEPDLLIPYERVIIDGANGQGK